MMENGTKTYNTERERKYGLITLNLLEPTEMEGKMGSVNTYGLMELSTKENGKTTKLQVMDIINGQMVENIWGIGRRI